MELIDKMFVEKYRPSEWDALIFDNKQLILNHLKSSGSVPSFLFFSSKPGTGKTTTAKLIIKTLGCDSITINAGDERGIDSIRDKVNSFARGMSSTNSKRCVFLDEFDSCTKIAQECLKSTMEEYSSTCFFIFTANDVSKIIEPIQSRCVVINFEKPNKADLFNRLSEICIAESISATEDEITGLIDNNYPDIRSMVKTLQNAKIENKPITIDRQEYEKFFQAIKSGNISYIYSLAYSGDIDIYSFNRWLFNYIFINYSSHCNVADIALCLAEVEKGYIIGVNGPVIFIANMVKISRLLK